MEESAKFNLSDAFTDQSQCSHMFQCLTQELRDMNSTVALLALEGLNCIGTYIVHKPHIFKTEQFELSCALTENIKNIIYCWRSDSPLRISYAEKSVQDILRCVSIFKSLNVPLYIGHVGYKRTLDDYGKDTEDISISGDTLVCLITGDDGNNGPTSMRNKLDHDLPLNFFKNTMNGRWFKVFQTPDSRCSKANNSLHNLSSNHNKNGASADNNPLLQLLLSKTQSEDTATSSVESSTDFNNNHKNATVKAHYGGEMIDGIVATTLSKLGVKGLCQGEVVCLDNADRTTIQRVFVILYSVNYDTNRITFGGLRKPTKAGLKRLHNTVCPVEIILFVADSQDGSKNSSLWFQSQNRINADDIKLHDCSDQSRTKNDKFRESTKTSTVESTQARASQAENNVCVSAEHGDGVDSKDSSSTKETNGRTTLPEDSRLKHNCYNPQLLPSLHASTNGSNLHNSVALTDPRNIKSNQKLDMGCNINAMRGVETNKNLMDLVYAFTSYKGQTLFFAQLTQQLCKVDETVGLLVLEGLCRLSRNLEELHNPEIKPLSRDLNGPQVRGIRKLLQKWVGNFPTGSVPEIWWKLRYCLLVYRAIKVPMFLDYLYKVTVRGLRSFTADQMDEVIIDGNTPIYHVTHWPEASNIVQQCKLKASDRKSTMKGTWFSPVLQSHSIYGTKCFKTTLSLLGVTGLYQGEIIYYRDERNIILYATNERGVQFKGVKKLKESFVKEESKTLQTSENRNPRPFVHISIFVPERFLPSSRRFRSIINQTDDVIHKPMCIHVCRGNRKTCDELDNQNPFSLNVASHQCQYDLTPPKRNPLRSPNPPSQASKHPFLSLPPPRFPFPFPYQFPPPVSPLRLQNQYSLPFRCPPSLQQQLFAPSTRFRFQHHPLASLPIDRDFRMHSNFVHYMRYRSAPMWRRHSRYRAHSASL